MNWLLCCTILYFTTAYAAIDVEKTVLRVQNILQENSQLPRLTRDEILQLLKDIRAEDAKITKQQLASPVSDKTNNKYAENGSSITDINENVVEGKEHYGLVKPNKNQVESTTKKATPTLTVVLPYTPRDGATLQELYTRPPRIEVVPVPKSVKKPDIRETLNKNAFLANKTKKTTAPNELHNFFNDNGIKNKPSVETFLLPLDGFKPLPPVRSSQGAIDLPENIILTYDLIPQGHHTKQDMNHMPPSNVLYEPLKPELPFELDESASEYEESVLPLDLPENRKTKGVQSNQEEQNQPLKVIPLNQGPLPGDADDKVNVIFDVNKRQTDNATSGSVVTTTESAAEVTTIAADTDSKLASTNDAALPDSGASITDLEESFGGAVPSQPGDSEIPPPKKNGFYWMLDWNSFLEVGDGDTKVNIRFEPKLGDPQMFLPINVP